MKDIELIPTDDLIQELKKRFDSIIIYGAKDNPNKFAQHWEGNLATCVGMCRILE